MKREYWEDSLKDKHRSYKDEKRRSYRDYKGRNWAEENDRFSIPQRM